MTTVSLRCVRRCALRETIRTRRRTVGSRRFLGKRLRRGATILVEARKAGYRRYFRRITIVADTRRRRDIVVTRR
jgi:hypothetical protein